jgi:hypothetical protein
VNSGIEIRTSFFPLSWGYLFTVPRAAIDGYEYPLAWGTQVAPFAPGQHHVRIWVPWIFGPGGVTEAYVEVFPGQITGISYQAPWLTFMHPDVRHLGTRPWG